MVNFYAEIARGVILREDNFNATTVSNGISNENPGPIVATTDGDILSLSGTDSTHGIYEQYDTSKFPAIDTNTYGKFIIRAQGTGTLQVSVTYQDSTTDTFTMNLTKAYQTFIFNLSSGKTFRGGSQNRVRIFNQSVAGTNKVDYWAFCKSTPVTISRTDIKDGELTRQNQAISQVQFTLDNSGGKYGKTTSSRFASWQDHVRVWLSKYNDNALYRAFGGYVQWREPKLDPSHTVIMRGVGWGDAFKQTLVIKEYVNVGLSAMSNDIIQNFVNQNGGLTTFYQIANAYNQFPNTNVPYWSFLLKKSSDSLKELGDVAVALGSNLEMWVDESENFHVAPIGAWGTDPNPTNYSETLVVGKNIMHASWRQDITNLVNRLHYFGIEQYPGDGDVWSEGNASQWATERLVGFSTAALSDEATLFKQGVKSIKCHMTSGGHDPGAGGAFYYPSTKDLGINVDTLGSRPSANIWRVGGPPIVDFYFREENGVGPQGLNAGNPATMFFANDANNRFEYILASDGNTATERSWTAVQGDVAHQIWYHVVGEIGPFAGDRFFFQKVGNPSWGHATDPTKRINYVGIFWESPQGIVGGNQVDLYVDGLKIQGGRYNIAYDARTVYPDGSPVINEQRNWPIFDPVAKDATALINLAKTELFRLRNPIIRCHMFAPLLGDMLPGQTVSVTSPNAGLTAKALRVTMVKHHITEKNFITEIEATDDFVHTNPIEPFKAMNMFTQQGHPGHHSREFYDLKSAGLDPTFVPVIRGYT